jgi:hypothetical protein
MHAPIWSVSVVLYVGNQEATPRVVDHAGLSVQFQIRVRVSATL